MTDLSVPDVARLRGQTPRAVRKAVAQNRLPARRIVNGQGGAGGVQYRIPLAALTPDEQARYWAERERLAIAGAVLISTAWWLQSGILWENARPEPTDD